MSWAHIQTNGTVDTAAGATVAHTLSSSVTSGSLLVFHVVWTTVATAIASVSDGVNSWQESGTSFSEDSGTFRIAAYYAMGVASGATTITVTFADATPTFKTIIASEYSGIATSLALDVTKNNTQAAPGTGTDVITSGSTTATSEANELVVAMGLDRSGSATTMNAGTGFTARGAQLDCNFYQLRTEDKNLVSAGDAISTWSLVPGQGGGISGAVKVSTFKEAVLASEPPLTRARIFLKLQR